MKVLLSLYGIFTITALITHTWTVVIAFSKGGFFAGVLSFFLPFLSELYWMVKMFGENNTYSWIALVHLIFAFLFALIDGGKR